MNKTVTAHISGIIFHIESDAYEKLNKYLGTIRKYFDSSEGAEEIMTDIEARIAELFKERLKDEREVVTMEDVDNVIAVMGEPEQYVEADPETESSYESKSRYDKEKFYSKKLFRDPDDRVLGGVCSGIGHYFGIDRIWIRIAFLVAFFAFGFGLIPYIILWIIMPEAKTAGDKLEMKGEPVTVDNIGRTIREEFDNFKKKVNGDKYSEGIGKAENVITRIVNFIAKIIVFLFNFLVKFLAVILIFVAGFTLLSLTAGFFAAPGFFSFTHSGFDFIFQRELLELLLLPGFLYTISIVGVCMFIAIPLIAIMYAGLKLILNFRVSNKIPGLILGSLWLISIFILLVSGFYVSKEFSYQQSDSEILELSEVTGDTLYLGTLNMDAENGSTWGNYDNSSIYIQDDKVFIGSAKVDVYRSNGKSFELMAKSKAYGETRKEAQNRLENIEYHFQVKDSLMLLSNYYSFPKEDMFRDQKLKYKIGIPTGSVIFFRSDSQDIIYDIKNVNNTWDPEMIGHFWMMKEEGLTCLDCTN